MSRENKYQEALNKIKENLDDPNVFKLLSIIRGNHLSIEDSINLLQELVNETMSKKVKKVIMNVYEEE